MNCLEALEDLQVFTHPFLQTIPIPYPPPVSFLLSFLLFAPSSCPLVLSSSVLALHIFFYPYPILPPSYPPLYPVANVFT